MMIGIGIPISQSSKERMTVPSVCGSQMQCCAIGSEGRVPRASSSPIGFRRTPCKRSRDRRMAFAHLLCETLPARTGTRYCSRDFPDDAATTPNWLERWPLSALANPSAASPRLSNSRTAAARLGMRRENRHVSRAATSSLVSMIWRRSPRVRSPTISDPLFC